MLSNVIEIKIKHLIIIGLVFIAYWYVIDKANKPDFKNDVEGILKTNISDKRFNLIKNKTHTLTGVLCMAARVIMNGLPVNINSFDIT